MSWFANGWPFIAIFLVCLLIGKARMHTEVKTIALVVVVFLYAIWIEQSTQALHTAPSLLSGQVAAFLGQVVVFFALGAIGLALTDRKVLT